MKITESTVQYALFKKLATSCSLIVPNYTPKGWFECDLFSVTKSGFFQEHEIKLSLADFKKDATKAREKFSCVDGKWANRKLPSKHQRLLEFGDIVGPTAFYFVTTKELLDEIDAMRPAWAGLKYISDYGHWLNIVTIRQAPRIHQSPVAKEIIDHARGVCYWRFWKERRRVIQMNEKHGIGG